MVSVTSCQNPPPALHVNKTLIYGGRAGSGRGGHTEASEAPCRNAQTAMHVNKTETNGGRAGSGMAGLTEAPL